jgi:hypothetical protein
MSPITHRCPQAVTLTVTTGTPSHAPDVEGNRHDGTQQDDVREEDEDGDNCSASSDRVAVLPAAWYKYLPRQVGLEAVSHNALPDSTADHAE